jgi:hypothetical protein
MSCLWLDVVLIDRSLSLIFHQYYCDFSFVNPVSCSYDAVLSRDAHAGGLIAYCNAPLHGCTYSIPRVCVTSSIIVVLGVSSSCSRF